MIDEQKAILVVIDVQGNLARVVSDSEQKIRNIVCLIQGAQALALPILVTSQVPQKIGFTIPEVMGLFNDIHEIPRVSFSVMRNPEMVEAIRASGRSQVVLCGFETHICIYQSSIDLLAEDFDVYVVADATSSRSEENKNIALTEMRAQGVHLMPVEGLFFSMLKSADHQEFKTIARLIK